MGRHDGGGGTIVPGNGVIVDLPELGAEVDDVLRCEAPSLPDKLRTLVRIVGEREGVGAGVGVGTGRFEHVDAEKRLRGPAA